MYRHEADCHRNFFFVTEIFEQIANISQPTTYSTKPPEKQTVPLKVKTNMKTF